MRCPRCGADVVEVAHFCQTCGLDLTSSDPARRKSFAVKPDEPVASFTLISTIMPRGAGQRPRTYRFALGIGLVVALLAAIFGALPIAILVAAFTIPIVYIVYLYDVNVWEDEPLLVTAAAFLLTGALTVAFTIGWMQLRGPLLQPAALGGSVAGPRLWPLLLVGVLVPIVAQLIIQIGPVYLASRPKFDDLMDGLTFGVISGVSYATFDTLVRHSAALFGGFGGERDAASWVALIFLEGLVKPLIMGTAAGIAAAEFSGLGRGYDGFTLRYARGFAEAVLANIAFQVGAYLFSFLPTSQGIVVTLLWGLLILGVLILRVRTVLHAGLMEAALEHAARRDPAIGAAGELEFCAACEMPLVPGAAFCNNCGTAVRVAPRSGRADPAGRTEQAARIDQGRPGRPGWPAGPSASGAARSTGALATAARDEPPTSPPPHPSPHPSPHPTHPSSQATPERPRSRTDRTDPA